MARARVDDPERFDVAAFAAGGGELAGTWPLERLPRLVESTLVPADAAPDGTVEWRVDGAIEPLFGAGRQPRLAIDARTEVTLECQRCLQPFRHRLHAARRIFFVEGEDEAAALDADADDDVLALKPAIDLVELVEDELLLCLPLVPRHEVCPQPLVAVEADAAPRASPFAALAALRPPASSNEAG